MNSMFKGCLKLTSINGLEYFDTNNVIDTSEMFRDCRELININLGEKFTVEKVLYFENIFSGCYKLEKSHLTYFNTQEVIDMSSLFEDCYSLKEIKIDKNKFNTRETQVMQKMFKIVIV